MERLKLKLNTQKTRCLRCPEEAFEFLGYRIRVLPVDVVRYVFTRFASLLHVLFHVPVLHPEQDIPALPNGYIQRVPRGDFIVPRASHDTPPAPGQASGFLPVLGKLFPDHRLGTYLRFVPKLYPSLTVPIS